MYASCRSSAPCSPTWTWCWPNRACHRLALCALGRRRVIARENLRPHLARMARLVDALNAIMEQSSFSPRPGRHGPAGGACLTQTGVWPLRCSHEFPEPGIPHQLSSSSPDPGKSHRFPGSSPPSDTPLVISDMRLLVSEPRAPTCPSAWRRRRSAGTGTASRTSQHHGPPAIRN